MLDLSNVGTVPVTTFIAMIITLIICVGFPIGLMFIAKKQLKTKLRPVFVGVITFILFAVMLESTLNNLVVTAFGTKLTGNIWLYALYGGLAAAIFEEIGRFLSMKIFLKNDLKKENSIMYGIGHGGIEAIFIIGSAYISNIILGVLINSGNLNLILSELDEANAALAITQLAPLWESPSYLFLISSIERVLAFFLQIAMSYFMYRAVKDKNLLFFLAAFLIHFVVDAGLVIAGYFLQTWAVYLILFAETILVCTFAFFSYKKGKEQNENNVIKTEVIDNN